MTVYEQVKSLVRNEDTKKRFAEILGERAPQYLTSVLNTVAESKALQECTPTSIMAAAMKAATTDLPIDSNLGFAAIVPYDKSYRDENGTWKKIKLAQFQMMYRGFVQLAIRSGQYKKMNVTEVYEDELVEYNPITGECEFVESYKDCTQRKNGETDSIVGYYAWFKLISGFEKELYMTKADIINHATTYSQSYKYDISKGKQSSRWSTDFNAMAKKTVLKQLLSKWGILSIQMQKAIEVDQMTFDENGNGEYGDNQEPVVVAEDPFDTDVQVVDIDVVEEVEE